MRININLLKLIAYEKLYENSLNYYFNIRLLFIIINIIILIFIRLLMDYHYFCIYRNKQSSVLYFTTLPMKNFFKFIIFKLFVIFIIFIHEISL